MSVTCGFYNARNHDRRYDAVQMSSIFDGIIGDGVYMSVGGRLMVRANSGMTVAVGTGRAWFNHTWTLNDSVLLVGLPVSEVILNRIDAVVLEVNAEEGVRANTIKAVKGTPGTNPERPAMVQTDAVHQYPLAYISVRAGAEEIRPADITNMVGTSATPFVTGVVQTMDIDSLIARWGDQWNAYFERQSAEMEQANSFWKTQWQGWFLAQTAEIQAWYLNWERQWDGWYASQTADMEQTNGRWKELWQAWFYEYVNSSTGEYSGWKASLDRDFRSWWDSLKALLDGNPDAEFAAELLDLQNRVGGLEASADCLSEDRCVYRVLEDSASEAVTDGSGGRIECRKEVFVTEGADPEDGGLAGTVGGLVRKVEALESFWRNLGRELIVYDTLLDGGSWLFGGNEGALPTERILDHSGEAVDGRVILAVR